MNYKRWIIEKNNKQLALELSEECDTDPLATMIAVNRGYSDPTLLEEFFGDEPLFISPYEMLDMNKAVERINSAVENNEKIFVFGDYDCDGVTSTALLYGYLKEVGADVLYSVPDRIADGYGLNSEWVDKIHASGAKLIITVDNGVSEIDAVAHANKLGINVVITDHHLSKEKLPEAVAVVDPRRADDTCTFKEFAGVGVAFMLVCALSDCPPEEMIDKYGDLVAIGTIADVMPLIDQNRSIVKVGLEKLKNKPRTGLLALMRTAAIEKEKLTAGRISFGIAPRINAMGRMGDANKAVELLLTDDYEKALETSVYLCDLNSDRQQTEQKIFDKACEIIEQNGYKYNHVIVVCGNHWHSGVVGIAASKIVEKYGKPTIVLSSEGDIVHGSGRSVQGFSLFTAIKYSEDCLIRYGGHDLAAGVTLSPEKVEGFRQKINEYAEGIAMPFKSIRLDCRLRPTAINTDLIDALQSLEPCGNGNPKPIFGICGVIIEKITSLSAGKHLRLSCSKDGVMIECMMFYTSIDDLSFDIGEKVDLAVTLDVNEYGERRRPSIIVKDIRSSVVSQDEIEQQIRAFDSFKRGKFEELSEVLYPSREECAAFYKILTQVWQPLCRLEQRPDIKISLGKRYICIEVFKEFNFIEEKTQNGKKYIRKTNFSGKVDLKQSKILSLLKN